MDVPLLMPWDIELLGGSQFRLRKRFRRRRKRLNSAKAPPRCAEPRFYMAPIALQLKKQGHLQGGFCFGS